jgi:hypothetical protein
VIARRRAVRSTVLLFVIVLVPGLAPSAQAQGAVAGRAEAAVGLGVIGGAGLGTGDANLRTRDASDYRWFSVDSRIGGARVLEARVGFALTRRYAVEVRFGLSHPELLTKISADIEGAPDATLAERFDQYMVDAALVATLDRFRFGPVIPFISGGAGYLRQLHEGQTLVEEGVIYRFGGGVKYRLVSRDRGVLRGAGLRGDVGIAALSGGITVRDRPTPHLAASGSFYVAVF